MFFVIENENRTRIFYRIRWGLGDLMQDQISQQYPNQIYENYVLQILS